MPGKRTADFFAALFGFSEHQQQYQATQERLLRLARFTDVSNLHYRREKCDFVLDNGNIASAGVFSMPSVKELRDHVEHLLGNSNNASNLPRRAVRVKVKNIVGESRRLHLKSEEGAIHQAASQFNLLEFPSPTTIPEDGIQNYVHDHTQGPACAVACATGTAYRNYLVPVPFSNTQECEAVPTRGQTKKNQLNGLEDMEGHIVQRMKETLGNDPVSPWKVKNGYIESSNSRLKRLNEFLQNGVISEEELVSLLRIGVQEDTKVTDNSSLDVQLTQTYNSAISIGYSTVATYYWEPIARIVLKASYEATMLVGLIKAIEAWKQNKPAPPIYLTKVGGGVFRNDNTWIIDAMKRAIHRVGQYQHSFAGDGELDVRIVHFRSIENQYRMLGEGIDCTAGKEENLE